MHQRGHRAGLTEQEAKDLVLEAIAAGIDNDLGSGSNIDVCVITGERGLEHNRGAWTDPGLGKDDDSGDEYGSGNGNGDQMEGGRSQHGEAREESPPVRIQDEGVAEERILPSPQAAIGAGESSLLVSVRSSARKPHSGCL